MSAASDWLDAHAGAAPARLRARMNAALAAEAHAKSPEDPAEVGLAAEAHADIPEALAGAALRELEAVLQAPTARSAALALLSADALLTAAFEAAADAPDSVEQLSQRYDPARLAALLDA